VTAKYQRSLVDHKSRAVIKNYIANCDELIINKNPKMQAAASMTHLLES
jgi:hypothetical protein